MADIYIHYDIPLIGIALLQTWKGPFMARLCCAHSVVKLGIELIPKEM